MYEPKPGGSAGRSDRNKPSQADALVALAEGIELFHTDQGGDREAYACLLIDGHREVWPIQSRTFKRWLSRWYYLENRKAPNAQSVSDAIHVIAGRAIHEAPAHPIAVRLAEHQGAIWLDLADDGWRGVKVTAEGWRIVESGDCPIRFIRRRGMKPLAAPTSGGSLDELRGMVNLPDESGWILFVAFLVGCLRPTGPFPILCVNGEQGSAKSTLCRFARALIDPNVAPLRRPPRDDRDLMIAASNGWLVTFDNLSGIAPSLSDCLCVLATGGGFATRELYTDGDEKLFDAMRPVMLNGIDELASRPDLLDRALCLKLPTIPDEHRCDEADLFNRFEGVRPRILGALLDAVVMALRRLAQVQLDRLPRMADFAKWIVAAEPALGWTPGRFMEVYMGNRADANHLALEASPIGSAVLGLMQKRSLWRGTAGELMAELDSHHGRAAPRKQRGWPKSPRGMSDALRRIAPNLRAAGIDYRPPAEGDHRRIHVLAKVGIQPPTPPQPPKNGDGGDSEAIPGGRSSGGVGRSAEDSGDDRPLDNPAESAGSDDPGGVGGQGGHSQTVSGGPVMRR